MQHLRNSLSELASDADWQSSSILKVYQKKLLQLVAKIDAGPPQSESDVVVAEERLVFVSLYHRKNIGLAQWGAILRALGNVAPGRPVFSSEQDAHQRIEKAPHSHQQAFVALAVEPGDVMPVTQSSPRVVLGHRADVVLRESAYCPKNIRYFFHMQQYYLWQDGRLWLSDCKPQAQ